MPDAPESRSALRLLGAFVALAVAFAGAGIVLSRRADHPPRWDRRVADLASFVERERGLTFEHPVTVEFLDDAAFRRFLAGTPDEGQGASGVAEVQLKALGLVPVDEDLNAGVDAVLGEGVYGLYDDKTKTMYVRGQQLDDLTRSIAVHELTHALQDQRFGLTDRGRTSGEQAARTAVVEGDAVLVQQAWEAQLSFDRQERLARGMAGTRGDHLNDVPPVLDELVSTPYILGPAFVQYVIDRDGRRGRDRLFTNGPTTEEQILVPASYIAGDRRTQVERPKLRAGERLVRDRLGDFGMLSLLIVLAEHIDFTQARAAVDGWAGDAITTFRRKDVPCVRAAVRFDTAAEADRFGAAFATWSLGRPASHTVAGRVVTFESCGSDDAPVREKGHVSGVMGVALPLELARGLRLGGLSSQSATCVADRLVAAVGLDTLAKLNSAEDLKPEVLRDLQQRAAVAVQACGTAA